MRAALYARVSTEDQARDGFSLDAQMKRLESYCARQGYDIVDRYVDEGYSGRKTNRPEYRRMMDEHERWDAIVVLKMDRIHRNSMNFTLMMNRLNNLGKEFISIQDQFNTTTAMGRFVMDIIQRIAQLESEQIGERVYLGMEFKARSGSSHLGSGHPYGYTYDNGSLKVITDEAHTVRAIYSMYKGGSSMDQIAKYLNDADIPAKKGGAWSRQSISNILHNPVYTGCAKWDGILNKDDHEAIISVETYEAVNGPLEG